MQITVIAGGSTQPALDIVAPAFHQETGNAVTMIYNVGRRALARMDAGEVFDVIVEPEDVLERHFRPAGRVEEGGLRVGRMGLGVMIRADAPIPDISNVAALKRAVIDAESILFTTENSGRHIEAMLRTVGIYEQVQAKITRCGHGPELMDRVLRGEGREFAFLGTNAIRTYREKGIVSVGPLPEEVQHYLEFMAVPTTISPHKEVAWEFARFCAGPARPILAANGLV